ncbi:hypothetical protein [Paenibacillus polymyxa]|uniref:hypothetical protein n=1 Tax=Paenibacillus polymyxa TaxID=1406 RepID=UPI002ED1099C
MKSDYLYKLKEMQTVPLRVRMVLPIAVVSGFLNQARGLKSGHKGERYRLYSTIPTTSFLFCFLPF